MASFSKYDLTLVIVENDIIGVWLSIQIFRLITFFIFNLIKISYEGKLFCEMEYFCVVFHQV